MSYIRFPPPLAAGDMIGITAPSAGVGTALEQRLLFCEHNLQDLGYRVLEGECLRSEHLISAPARARAAELMDMMLSDSIHAIMPPWGGELLVDILPLLDFDSLAMAPAKWFLGYSDLTTFMFPYTLLTGNATAHGSNLMESPIHFGAEPIAHWNDVITMPLRSSFLQGPTSLHQVRSDAEDWRDNPHVVAFNCTRNTNWRCLGHERDSEYQVTARGRLIGGCLDVLCALLGSRFGDLRRFAHQYAPEGLLVYLENCDGNTAQFCRMLHAVRLAGWFDNASAVLLGRSAGPQLGEFSVQDALVDALGDLRIPVIYDMDIGHVPPQLLLVNGAQAVVTFGLPGHSLLQTLA